MNNYRVVFSRHAQRDAKKLAKSNLKESAQKLIAILGVDPFQNPPHFESLKGDLQGFYSRRINIQHRLVYEVDKESKNVLVLRMWTHYE
ncbi:Txe/YoeB family addiction module toxin [Opitutales bacterium]|nr:Txe/YoeB family addiction module toxin [Opitutales bacterium]